MHTHTHHIGIIEVPQLVSPLYFRPSILYFIHT